MLAFPVVCCGKVKCTADDDDELLLAKNEELKSRDDDDGDDKSLRAEGEFNVDEEVDDE